MLRFQRRMMAVMFTDIVGYSAMVSRDEQRALRLLELQRALVRRHVRAHGGEVVDTIGDGHFVTFDSALAAVGCAVALQAELAQRNARAGADDAVRLRVGLHAGDVQRRRGRAFGDGVNVAARVEPLAPAGGIAATAAVVAQVRGPLRERFVSIGPRSLKNIAETHEVFWLQDSGLAAAAPLAPRPGRWSALRRWRLPAAVAVAALALVAGGVARRTAAPADASIAVLPLENLSTEPDSASFVAGLHDSLLTEVSKARALRVISRTSVMRFAGSRQPVARIAADLGVGYILEGSVQRQQGRVRVNVQLIRARSDEHVWAHTYDGALDNLFDLQTHISREIARRVQGRLLVAAMPRSERPTHSVDAYDLYLQAIAPEDSDPALGREPPQASIHLLERAVGLDPRFALAHAALARYNIWAAYWAAYADPARKAVFVEAARRSAATASKLDPELPESLLAAGLVDLYSGDRAAAARRMEQALAVRPAYSLALFWLGNVYGSLGEADRSIGAIRALLEMDPYNERAYTQLAQQYLRQRDYAALAQAYARWRAFTSSPAFVDFWTAELAFYRTGALESWKAFLAQPPAEGLPQEDVDAARFQVAMYERRFDEAFRVTQPRADAFVRDPAGGDVLWALYAGQAMAAAGRKPHARPYLEAAVRYLEAMVAAQPDDAFALSVLGLAESALGREAQALEHGRRAVALSAPAAGQPPGPAHYEYVHYYAQAAARSGQQAEALARLEWLLSQPSGVHPHAELADPMWAPLDRSPEFQALVRKFLPRA